jgi:hypothetical protein
MIAYGKIEPACLILYQTARSLNPLLLESPGSAGGGMINEVVPARAGTPWNFKEVAGGRVIEGASGTAERYSMNIIRKSSCRRGATNPHLY